jgi:pimeloyl-ACP methyl ester carboxylesterase
MSTWVLLRGLTREARHWGEFPGRLAEALPDATPVCLDLPGNGRLSDRMSPLTVAGLLESVRAQLVAARAAPPYHLLALSLGGMVAVEWCLRHPAELAGAVLVNTSLRPFSPMHRRLRWQRWPTVLRLLFDLDGNRARERAVLGLTSRRAEREPFLIDDWVAWRGEHRVSRANALRQGVPLLVLGSRGDTLVDPRCSIDLARRWGVPLALHPDAGHDLPLDDADWVVDRIRAWPQAATASSANSAPI